jgi:hypothetical protein
MFNPSSRGSSGLGTPNISFCEPLNMSALRKVGPSDLSNFQSDDIQCNRALLEVSRMNWHYSIGMLLLQCDGSLLRIFRRYVSGPA